MPKHRFLVSIISFLAILSTALPNLSQAERGQQNSTAVEDAYRANNIGVALLEQFKYNEAADEFRRALKLNPTLAIARVNLAIALYNAPDPEGALREAKAAADLLPNAPQPFYIMG